jgi:hypothetical protein
MVEKIRERHQRWGRRRRRRAEESDLGVAVQEEEDYLRSGQIEIQWFRKSD